MFQKSNKPCGEPTTIDARPWPISTTRLIAVWRGLPKPGTR